MEGNMFFGIVSFFLKRKWTCKIYFLLLTAFFFSLSIGTVKGAGQLLCDSGFEDSTANGTFPTSGCWKSSSAGGGAYAVVTTTAAYNGNNGLWIYTGTETWAYWSRPYQEFSASPGQTYTGKAWIRTPSGEGWVNNSLACVRIEFLSDSKSVLKAKNSSGITTANSGWNEYSVTSDAAPANTKYVRFICNIEKPNGVSGISVANFDDTYLELTAEATPTPTPVASPTITIIPTPTTVPTPTTTPKVTPTVTPAPIPTQTPIVSPTPQPTASATPTATPKQTPSPTPTASPTATNNPIDLAYQHLYEVMDKYHNAFDVYTDQDAGGNHFYPSGWMGATETVSYDGNWTKDYHEGTSCIKITFTADGDNWAGIYWQDPENNWGTHTTGGYDLSGATKITFWAKGEKGGEKIEFFAGGITGDNPDSLEKTYAGTSTITTLSNSWKECTIDLASKDLSHIIGGFGWTANSDNNPNGATFYLDDIQYNKSRLDELRFLVSYETLSFIDPDRYIKNACYIYDNALALITFLERGTSDDLERAKILADAFVYAQKNDRYYEDGRLRNAYMSGDLKDHITGKARLPGWWDPDEGKWYEDQFQVSTHVGNLAWTMIALLNYYKGKGGNKYLEAAITLGEWIEKHTRDSECNGGYAGGYDGWEPNPDKITWKATEHNIDVYVAFTLLSEIRDKEKWQEKASHAKNFVDAMWYGKDQHFWTGTKDACEENKDNIPLDIQAWALMAFNKYNDALVWAENNCGTESDGFKGFDFNTDKDGVWFEGTAQMAVAYQINNEGDKSNFYVEELQKAQASARNTNGKGIIAASHDGVSTGFDWEYFSRLHIGATAWYIFAEIEYNPYWGTSTTTTPSPSPTPTHSPAVCVAEQIEVSPNILSIKRKKSATVTVSVKGKDNCPVEGETVTATINKGGQKRISISPLSQTTDENSQATFAITAGKKTGNARVVFRAGSLKKALIVKVKK